MAYNVRPTPSTAALSGAITAVGMEAIEPLQSLGTTLLWKNTAFLICAAIFFVIPAVFLVFGREQTGLRRLLEQGYLKAEGPRMLRGFCWFTGGGLTMGALELLAFVGRWIANAI